MKKARPVSPNLELKSNERLIDGNILKLKNVSKKFGDRLVLDDMIYDFNAGDTIGVVGAKYVGEALEVVL